MSIFSKTTLFYIHNCYSRKILEGNKIPNKKHHVIFRINQGRWLAWHSIIKLETKKEKTNTNFNLIKALSLLIELKQLCKLSRY